MNSEEPLSVVITGSTRGIGLGLSRAFLERGCRVVVSGKDEAVMDRALASLAEKFDPESFTGTLCDVSRYADLEKLRDHAVEQFGTVDIWINNAGRSQPWLLVHESRPEDLESIVRTNILGVIWGSQIAARTMIPKKQGMIVNTAGFGSDGSSMKRMALYGLSKRSVQYFTHALAGELKSTGVSAGIINPGMVATEFLKAPFEGRESEFEKSKWILNILSSTVERVTPWLADRILKTRLERRNDFRIAYSGPLKMMARFLTAPFVKRDIVG